MRRILTFGILLFLASGLPLRAANPDDIEFRLRLVKDTRIYHPGESIEMELSYSSPIEKKYYGSFSAPRPEFDGVTLHVTPTDGVLDLREFRPDRGGIAGSILSGIGYVGPQAETEQFDLCQWYRFQRPGYYSVTVTSTEVSRVNSAEEGGGREYLTLESNPVDFDILPADPAWDATEVSKIEQALNSAGDANERGRVLGRLAMLDTPASVQKLVRLYVASSDGAAQWELASGLRESSQPSIIIPLLVAALSDPATNVPVSLPGLLADLQTRTELGVMSARPADPAQQDKWDEEFEGRLKVHDRYVAQADGLLTASLERRSGPQRPKTIYQAWYDAEALNESKPLAPEVLSRLQSNVLAVADDLDSTQQLQFVDMAWQTMAHEQLLALVRKLAKESLTLPAQYRSNEPFRLWCEGWPEECHAAIFQEVVESNAKTDINVILLLPEAEHPELDRMLDAQLRDPATLQDWGQLQRTSAVILRAGSRGIASAVDSLLDQFTRTHGCYGETEGYLLGYLFRVAPKDAEKRLTTELQDRKDSCGTEVLRTLHSARPSDDLIPIVTKALDSPNLTTAQSAALYLGDHGSAAAEDALWQRLEALWKVWQGRSPGLPDEITSGDGSGIKDYAAMLERALASALSHAANWKLSPAELDHLRSSCLTQTCRDIADDKLSLNL